MFFLIYLAVFKIYSLIFRIKFHEITTIWYRNSLKLGYWSFGRSDIDVTILLKNSNSDSIKKINKAHSSIKKIFPVIGEVVYFDENLKDSLLKLINPLELKRDPELLKRYGQLKDITPADKILQLHKFIISNADKFDSLESRSKKIQYLLESLQLTLKKFSRAELIIQLAHLCNRDPEEFLTEYEYLLNNSLYPDSPAPKCACLYSLFFNKICFIPFQKQLSPLEKSILESTVSWELWGCYSNQTLENEQQLRGHIINLLTPLHQLINEEKSREIKLLAVNLGLLKT